MRWLLIGSLDGRRRKGGLQGDGAAAGGDGSDDGGGGEDFAVDGVGSPVGTAAHDEPAGRPQVIIRRGVDGRGKAVEKGAGAAVARSVMP